MVLNAKPKQQQSHKLLDTAHSHVHLKLVHTITGPSKVTRERHSQQYLRFPKNGVVVKNRKNLFSNQKENPAF
jgi:hypothetical protein